MIEGSVSGDAQVVRTLGRLGPELKAEVVKATGRIVLRLLTKVKAEKLSGQVLNVRTGRLRRSITQRVEQTEEAVTGVVGTNVDYARRHEFGFTGTENVKEHMRLVKQAFGLPLKHPVWSTVGAHTREANYPPHSFLRASIKELRDAGVIDAEYRKAVGFGVREASR